MVRVRVSALLFEYGPFHILKFDFRFFDESECEQRCNERGQRRQKSYSYVGLP